MSYVSWHTYGYGICTSELRVQSLEQLQSIIDNAPKFKKEIELYFMESEIISPTLFDYLEYNDGNMEEGIGFILRKVIEENEHIGLTVCDDFSGKQYLLYEPNYPWNISENDYNLTTEKLDYIFNQYVSPLINMDVTPDYYSVENGG